MTATTAQDPFKLAMAFEEIGHQFYSDLSLASEDGEVRALFATLAKAEKAHQAMFARLGDSFQCKNQRAVSDDDAIRLAKTHILPASQSVRETALWGGKAKAIELALQLEHNGILYYRDLISVLPECRQELDSILDQERQHVRMLRDLQSER